MIKNSQIMLLGFLLSYFGSSIIYAKEYLTDFNFTSASVLPVFTYNNTQYIILARESEGNSRGMYDDFGGGREKNETHPLLTAAREFFEEGILHITTGLTLEQVQNYIDINRAHNTVYIICYSRHQNKKKVTYVVKFDRYKDDLLYNFYHALKQVTESCYKEKDRIAIVKWDIIKKAIKHNKDSKNITVKACVVHPKMGVLTKKYIKLRSSFVKKLRFFFLNKPYKRLHKKIRLYDQEEIGNVSKC